jgi:diguanylate cyclase (GGDEF)-like protein
VILDLRTIYIVASLTSLALGFIQLGAFYIRRLERWSVFSGLSNVAVGIGMLGTALRGVVPDFVAVDLANFVTLLSYLLLVAGVRSFSGRRIPWWIYAIVAIGMTAFFEFILNGPTDYVLRIAAGSTLSASLDLVVAREGIYIGRRQQLTSASIMVGLFSFTAFMFAGRVVLALTGNLNGTSIIQNSVGPYQWIAVSGAVLITLRTIILMLMAAERSQNQLIAVARRDPLTGAFNRIGLRSSFDRLMILRRPKHGTMISVLAIDIDHFKGVNDTHGHMAGDEVLRVFARVAKTQLRQTDILARQGGDEFVVILPQTRLDDAVMLAERIREAFARATLDFPHLASQPTLSIGAAEGDAIAIGFDAILQQADDALYRSKRQGRNQVSAHLLTASLAQERQSFAGATQ